MLSFVVEHACITYTSADPPSAPEGPITYEDILETSVVVQWKLPKETGGLPITAYHLERRDKKYFTWIKVDTVKPHITSFCVQNLLEGGEYYFRVFAENEEGLSAPLESVESVIPHRPPGF
jgi:titin